MENMNCLDFNMYFNIGHERVLIYIFIFYFIFIINVELMWNEITDPITELTWPTRANGYPIIVKVAKECGTFSYRREISLSRKGNMKKKIP